MRIRSRLFLAVLAGLLPSLSRHPNAQGPFEVLHQFLGSPDGAVAIASLIEGPDGYLYGTTQQGGQFGAGTVYRMTTGGAVTILHHFNGADGSLPSAALLLASDGNFYGTTTRGGLSNQGTVYRIAPSGAFASLHSFFTPGIYDGSYAPLIQGNDGNLYGVTFGGGQFGCGRVFSLTLAGTVTTLHEFNNVGTGNCSPFGPVTQAADGLFYGTTRLGGIYRISASGDFAMVRALNVATEGATLDAPLALASDGSLYGAAREGGPNGLGTIFRITTAGAFTVMHAFTGGSDGSSPEAGLVLAPDGNFYGATVGPYTSATGRVLFRMTPAGTLTPLHTFAPSDSQTMSRLLVAADGFLYGTTNSAGGRSIAYRFGGVLPAAAPPFGSFDTPPDQSVVAGEVPVTGWALDNTGVTDVTIYRSPVTGEPTQPNGLVLIGSATFVEGARPDVAALYPQYPANTRAGWGYMLLSNMLPNAGNGSFTLTAFARDGAGNVTNLGDKRITAANTGSTKPFGTIDTPAQGATVSGIVDNFGWALTPQPSMIPFDGSTITVYVDGVAVGHPTYDLYRPDIAAAFPGYANTNGAVGYFSLDTRTLTNGVHILAWVVVDNNGNTQGIGSRYITVANP